MNPGAINLDEEIKRFEWKVEAGAQYAITQPVFDTGQLRDFLKRIEHVRIPVIAGIWPLVSYRNAEFLHNEVPGMSIPAEYRERMAKVAQGPAARAEGIGLGLTIAGEIVQDYYGGDLELLDVGPLSGATFRITLRKRV